MLGDIVAACKVISGFGIAAAIVYGVYKNITTRFRSPSFLYWGIVLALVLIWGKIA